MRYYITVRTKLKVNLFQLELVSTGSLNSMSDYRMHKGSSQCLFIFLNLSIIFDDEEHECMFMGKHTFTHVTLNMRRPPFLAIQDMITWWNKVFMAKNGNVIMPECKTIFMSLLLTLHDTNVLLCTRHSGRKVW